MSFLFDLAYVVFFEKLVCAVNDLLTETINAIAKEMQVKRDVRRMKP